MSIRTTLASEMDRIAVLFDDAIAAAEAPYDRAAVMLLCARAGEIGLRGEVQRVLMAAAQSDSWPTD